MGVTRFESVVAAQAVGTADINALTEAINKQSGALDALANKATKVSEHPGFAAFAEKLKAGIQDPLATAGEGVEALLTKLGPLGTGVAAGVGVFAALATAAKSAALSLGEYGTTIQNVSTRTGLSTKEVGQFSFAAKVAGQDVSVFESAMRKLSQGLSDNSEDGKKAREGLQQLGVQAISVHGEMKPMSEIFLQISEGLNAIASPAERNAAALKVFGRAGIEILPTIIGLSENLNRAKELGLGPNPEDVRRWEEYHRKMVEVETAWDRFARTVKEPLAATLLVFLKFVERNPGKEQVGLYGAEGSTALDIYDSDQDEVETLPGQKNYLDLRAALKRYVAPSADAAKASFDRERYLVESNNAAIKEALEPSSKHDLEGQLMRGRHALEDLRAQLKTGVLPEVNKDTFDKIAKQEETNAGLERQIKRIGDLKQAEQSLEQFEKQMAEKDLGPIGRIFAQRDDLLAKGANPERSTNAALSGAGAEFGKLGLPEVERLLRGEDFSIEMRSGVTTTASALGYSAVLAELQTAEDKKQDFERKLKLFEQINREQEEQAKAAGERAKAAAKAFTDNVLQKRQTAREILNINMNEQRGELISMSGRATRMAEINAGPGGEASAIATGYQERLNLAKQLFMLELDRASKEDDQNRKSVMQAHAFADLKKELYDREIEHELKIAELRRKRIEEEREMAGRIFDAATSGRGASAFTDLLKNVALGQGRTMFQNAAEFGITALHRDPSDESLWKHLTKGTYLQHSDPLSAPAAKLNSAGFELSAVAKEWMAVAERIMAGDGTVSLLSRGGGTFSGSGYSNPHEYGGAASDGTGYSNVSDEYGNAAAMDGWYDSPSTDGTSGSQMSSRMARAYRDIGVGMAAAGAGFGAYNGIRSGGIRGEIEAAGSLLGGAGGIIALLDKTSALGPAGLIAGMGLGFLSSVLPNPKQERADYEQRMMLKARYVEPASNSYTVDRYGQNYDTDTAGSSRPMVHITVNLPVHAMDAQSVVDNAHHIAAALSEALEANLSPRLATALKATVLPPK